MTTPDPELSLRLRHPDFQEFLDINERESQRVRTEYTCHVDQKYGDNTLQTLDIFPSGQDNSPVLIFIHGGYWRALDKGSYSFVAEPFVRHNMTVCIINYRLIPTAKMETVVNDISQVITWIQQNAQRYHGNPSAITLSGHSAGGHLALLTYILKKNLRASIQAICSLSGIFDLEPIQNSYLDKILQLSKKDVHDFSIVNKDLSVLKCPTLLSVGSGETNFFIQQSRSLFSRNKSIAPLEYYEYPELNHYQIAHKLGHDDSIVVRFILGNCRC